MDEPVPLQESLTLDGVAALVAQPSEMAASADAGAPWVWVVRMYTSALPAPASGPQLEEQEPLQGPRQDRGRDALVVSPLAWYVQAQSGAVVGVRQRARPAEMWADYVYARFPAKAMVDEHLVAAGLARRRHRPRPQQPTGPKPSGAAREAA